MAKKHEEDVDLLAGLDDEETKAADDDDFDLLDNLTEDNGTPWMPWDDEDQPKGIQGKVTYVGSVDSDYPDADEPDPELRYKVPYLEVTCKDGTTWSIRGYSGVLKNQIRKVDPHVGDTFAVKYLGLKASKKRIDRKTKEPINYKNFKAVKA